MKKILTVSLFAMMAVSAANADIASTKYVTDRTGTVSFTANGIAKDASNLTEAINLIDSTLKSTSDTLTGDITGGINELKGNVKAIEGSAAMTSGITSDKVATYDGYSDKISQNKSAIIANTTSINTINDSAVMNSGVTDKVVKSVETHTNDINTIKASDVMKSGVTADVVAKAKSAMQEANLKALESWTTGQCAEPTVTCSLISKGGKIAWEVVTY